MSKSAPLMNGAARRRIQAGGLALCALTLLVPVVWALSLEVGQPREAAIVRPGQPLNLDRTVATTPRTLVPTITRTTAAASPWLGRPADLPDVASLFVVGSMLLGLAAAVRKTS